jgi:ABC-type phosphate/phosphonate transport system substrate-binding protein
VSDLVANARMYAVTPAAEEAWRALFEAIGETAAVRLSYRPHPAPAPLDELWDRPDLGLALMCGWPFANLYPNVRPVAAPIPAAGWAGGRGRYRTHLTVRAKARYRSLEETAGLRAGWTAEHSQSGYHAVRGHEPALDAGWTMVGPLVTPRRVIEALLAGEIEIGPLDSYWHDLFARHEPDMAARLRVIEATRATPMPLLVASPGVEAGVVRRLQAALAGLAPGHDLLAPLGLTGFAPVARSDYEELVARPAAS